MLGIQFTIPRFLRPQPFVLIAPGTHLLVMTSHYGIQEGVIDSVGDSPFYNEQGIQSAFVVSADPKCFWTEYVAVDEIDIDDVLDNDSDYIDWLHALEQTARMQELAD